MVAALGVLAALGAAHAAEPIAPPLRVGLVAEPSDVVEQYRAQARAAGRSDAASELVCRDAFDALQLCLTVRPEGAERWRLGTRADLAAWSGDAAAALAAGGTSAAAEPLKIRLQKRMVEGTEHAYWASDVDDGLDAAALLKPIELQLLIGGPPVIAVPAQGAVVTWVPGHPVRDEILAVGVRRMHEAAGHPISSRIYRWDGKRWVVWGEATNQGR